MRIGHRNVHLRDDQCGGMRSKKLILGTAIYTSPATDDYQFAVTSIFFDMHRAAEAFPTACSARQTFLAVSAVAALGTTIS